MGADKIDLPVTRETDVLVIGGGGAGMAAALSAAETDPDADVLLLQKLPQLGGSTTMAAGSFSAAGTYLQEERGIEDSPEAHFQDMDKLVQNASDVGRYSGLDFSGDMRDKDDLELRRVLVDEGGNTLAWLHEHGCEYAGPYMESPHRVPRMHQIVPDTTAYREVLGDRLAEEGVDVVYNAEVYELIYEDGAVLGAIADQKSKTSPMIVQANRGTILATGDYVNSDELKDRYGMNTDAEAINENNVGAGHLMAESVGAELVNMENQYLIFRFGDPLYAGPELRELVDAGAIVTNERGERFINEESDYDQIFDTVLRQHESIYIVFDGEIADKFNDWPHAISTFGKNGKAYGYTDDYLETDVLARGNSPEALAEKVGLDPDRLRTSIDEYNFGLYDETFDTTMDKFGRKQRKPLVTLPLFALGPAHPYSLITTGGVRINTDFQPLTEDGEPIDRLYAAGSVAEGGLHLFGHGHHHNWIFTSGRIAGSLAADSQR